MYYLNPEIKELNRVFDQNKRTGYLRLDLNENPGGLPEEIIKKALDKVNPEFVAQYPETLEFTQTLASYLGTDISNICLVNGSAEGIRYIIEAFTSPGGLIVGVTPTYAMFEVYSEMYGRKYCPVTYTDDLEMTADRIISKLTDDVELLILLNPNNPIGNVYSEDELEAILKVAEEKEISVLIDEAYHYFHPKTFIRYALENEHVFVTRTFSKLFSMAGCRLGYVVGGKAGIEIIQKLCTPHNVNAFAMLFASEIIKTDGMVESLIAIQNDGKRFLAEFLTSHGYQFKCGAGNFAFIKPKTNADMLVKNMKEHGILIKAYSGIGEFGNCLRVTTGAKQYMEQFLNTLLDLDVK